MRVTAIALATTIAAAMTAVVVDMRGIGQPTVPEACALFTLGQAGQATGRTFRRTRPGSQPGATTCDLIGGTEGNINVVLSPSASKKDFDEFRTLLEDQGEKLEAVSGVGDDAYYWGTRIYVRAGARHLTIWNGDPMQPAADVRADVLALAKLAQPKLK